MDASDGERANTPKAAGSGGANTAKQEQLSDEQMAALRHKYINKINLYERETKPEIEKLNLQAWSPESIVKLQEQEQKAVQAFAQNQLAEALRLLDSLLAQVAKLQTMQNQNFGLALEKARQAFAAAHTQQALAAINDALRYQPDNRDAHLLKDRIKAMAAVAELLKQADAARAENKLDEEIKLLGEAINHDPHRRELVERHRLLVEKKRQQRLDILLQQAAQAINQKNIKQAQAKLLQVKQIDAQHRSLRLLENKIKQLQMELSHQSLIAKAAAAEQNDDWQATAHYYQQAQQIFPDNQYTEERLQRATKIIRYTQIIQQALARPQRLADEQISMAMKELVKESSDHAKYSAQLQALTEQLNDAIAEMSRPVEVLVYSDQQTYVSVLGVGVIGKLSQYRLKEGLKPGRYLFKGERRGFKDKLVEVYIKPNQAVTVRVVCDETI